ncbi:MAG: AAA family ATPase [Actinomycetota bacterium]|nr:AAA family ATPase [Actinomycetota bacterium]
MILRYLELTNYRNHKELRLTPSPSTTLILGGNAQGKTDILEAIYLLATSQSHRTQNNRDMINWGATFSLIRAVVEGARKRSRLDILIGEDGSRKARLNGAAQARTSDLLGTVRAVLFSPEDINTVKGEPGARRAFMDDGRRPRLLAVIREGTQAIITSTNRSYFSPGYIKDALLIDLASKKGAEFVTLEGEDA